MWVSLIEVLRDKDTLLVEMEQFTMNITLIAAVHGWKKAEAAIQEKLDDYIEKLSQPSPFSQKDYKSKSFKTSFDPFSP